MKVKLTTISLAVVVMLTLAPVPVLAWNAGAGVTTEFDDPFYDDACEAFIDTIGEYTGWHIYWLSHWPYSFCWREESDGGMDDVYADNCELALLLAHGVGEGTATAIRFSEDDLIVDPNTVRLGYASPDGSGRNIWTFFIVCELFKDGSHDVWANSLAGAHMLLGFKNSPNITNFDVRELAYRLTGTGGFSQQNVQWSFFCTYVDTDGIHDANVARILAENAQVADNDMIDSFDPQVPVDSSKITITYSY